MKKIVLAILIPSFIITLFSPAKALATACCSQGYHYVDNSQNLKCCKDGSSDCNITTLNFDRSKYQCGNNTCDASGQQCTQTIQASGCSNPKCDSKNFDSSITRRYNVRTDLCCNSGDCDNGTDPIIPTTKQCWPPSCANPKCDTLNFNSSGRYNVPLAQCCRANDCNNGTDLATIPQTKQCWPKGATTSNPTCPKGYIDIPAGILVTCTGDTAKLCCPRDPNNPQDCIKKSGAFGVCACNQSCYDTVPKNSCPDPTTQISVSGKCEKVIEAVQRYGCGPTNNRGEYTGVDTAIGCIPVNDLRLLLGFLLRWVFGIAGGVILVMLIITGYGLLTSQGNPEKLQAAKENLISIFSGLILIAFSLVLLQTIGAGILNLPTF